ncbi:MAG: F0F1 ATP synthase subunit epsilon [Kiloniellales bacterium]
MAEDSVAFELVSPEALLLARQVEMVVVPGAEGDFGVLPRHAPMISTLRPGIISVYEDSKVTERIFVGGGFAEVTPARCTVLAEEAIPVAQLERAKIEQGLKDAREELADAKDEAARRAAEKAVAIAEAKLQAAGQTA